MRPPKLLAGLAFFAYALTASAQQYPTRPVSIVVPFAAGGPTDTVARSVAVAMEKSLGGNVIVENKPGAGGTIGVADVARAPPTATSCSSITSAWRRRRRCTASCRSTR